MNTRLIPTARVLAVLLLAPGLAIAQSKVAYVRPLVFGKFAAGTGGSITVSPTGARSRVGGVFLVSSLPGSAATFNLSSSKKADASQTFTIDLPPPNSVTLSRTGGGSMVVSQFTSAPTGAGQLVNNNLTMTVGGTLTVGANQAPGAYSGTFTLTINYN